MAENISQFFNLEDKTWSQLPDINIGGNGQMKEVNNKLFMVTSNDKLETFLGGKWIVLNIPLPISGGNTRLTKVPVSFAEWLMTLSDVDWARQCSADG